MSWDGIERRASSRDGDSVGTILGRIDERVKNINDKLTVHIVSFEEHRKDDEKNFSGLYKWVFIGVGIIGTLQFIIMTVKN